MEKKEKSKIQVVDDGHPRGKNITYEEVKQAIFDLKSWFKQKAPSASKLIEATKAATEAEIKQVEQKCNLTMLKELQCIFLTCNGNFQLHDTFITLNTNQLIDINSQNVKLPNWKKSYLTFAQDVDKNLLICDNENGQVLTLTEDGDFQLYNDNIGLYFEKLSNQVLKKKLEFVEGCGLIERTN